MEESAKRRRAELIKEIRRHRQSLKVLELADRVPSLARLDAATHEREIEKKLHLMFLCVSRADYPDCISPPSHYQQSID
jgi:hypothetical protein